MQPPEINLSPMERRILDGVAHSMPAEVLFDWVAFRRLLAFGYLEESETGRIQATAAGRRALADMMNGDGSKEE
jgi:hypothetical protein